MLSGWRDGSGVGDDDEYEDEDDDDDGSFTMLQFNRTHEIPQILKHVRSALVLAGNDYARQTHTQTGG